MFLRWNSRRSLHNDHHSLLASHTVSSWIRSSRSFSRVGVRAPQPLDMLATTQLLVGGHSDAGRKRAENEDRFFIDAQRGIFLVVDGLGGHAAGERAAEIAVDIISTRLSRRTGASDKRIQEAFALASTEIFKAASRNPEWAGMACVATVALIEGDQVTVGHVGDSRLYLLAPGSIEKITRDHSPVGELEDSQKLSEDAAMRHPRRNEVYRDLGSEPHSPNDTDFVEIHSFALAQSAALLICSDGLSDQVTAADVRLLVEHHAGDPDKAALALVNAANEAGGKDNVTVVLIETEDYAKAFTAGENPQRASRHSHGWIWLLLGLLAASAVFLAARPYWEESSTGLELRFGKVSLPRSLTVGPKGISTIEEALEKARPGDTIEVSPGEYHEALHLRSGISVVSTESHGARIFSSDVAVSAVNIHDALFVGFDIAGPGRVGIRIADSDVNVKDVRVSGMQTAGVEISGSGKTIIKSSDIVDNPGTGISVRENASPHIDHNFIRHNGHGTAMLPGVSIEGTSAPTLFGNIIEDSGAEQIWVSPFVQAGSLLTDNVVAPQVHDNKNQLKVKQQ
jgi:PPM family protein phosphatase